MYLQEMHRRFTSFCVRVCMHWKYGRFLPEPMWGQGCQQSPGVCRLPLLARISSEVQHLHITEVNSERWKGYSQCGSIMISTGF